MGFPLFFSTFFNSFRSGNASLPCIDAGIKNVLKSPGSDRSSVRQCTGFGCWDIRLSDFLWNGVGDGRKRHQSALHGGGVFLRLPVAELLVVWESLECLISHTMYPVHCRTEHGIAKNDYGSYDRVVLKISKNYKRIILKPSWECQNLIVAKWTPFKVVQYSPII